MPGSTPPARGPTPSAGVVRVPPDPTFRCTAEVAVPGPPSEGGTGEAAPIAADDRLAVHRVTDTAE
ncbi:hypothetical protein tb265_40220 [Gemmatimonadetes bacterium T265]|nr:hypothetical protein tb265_40220 [Gemmatimonadetes bacterium T265]